MSYVIGLAADAAAFETAAPAPESKVAHICVCTCTYKRPRLLIRLLQGLSRQETGGQFTFSILVVDNDSAQSAEAVVGEAQAAYGLAIAYCVEPTQNIALARNKAVANAKGHFLAFIDDDEFPTNRWLLTLFEACKKFGADGALGPVKPYFDVEPPKWVVDGNFYDRPSYPTGYVIDGAKGRTGNTLLKMELFAGPEPPFRPEFLTGEDQDFFRRAIAKGYRFVWCHEAMAYEVVLPLRWNRRFMLKRALLRGAVSLRHPTSNAANSMKSVIAIPVYAMCLPVSLVFGQGRFMRCLVSMFDHLGKVLALVGVFPIKEAYITE
jgi:glycosyltransferase involved in cell wall biosynthesis